jgi:hypothetical protein
LKPTDDDSASMRKEADGVGKCVFAEHAPGVARNQGVDAGFAIVGEENRRLLMAEIRDEELAKGAMSDRLEDARTEILAMRHIEGEGAPRGRRQPGDLFEQFARTTPQGHEDDVRFVKPIKPFVGGELGVEHQELWRTTVLAGSEIDEAKDLVCLLALTDIGV